MSLSAYVEAVIHGHILIESRDRYLRISTVILDIEAQGAIKVIVRSDLADPGISIIGDAPIDFPSASISKQTSAFSSR